MRPGGRALARAGARLAATAAAPSLLLGAWWWAAARGWPSPRATPSPADVATLAGRELGASHLWRDLAATLTRAGLGLALAVAIGVTFGVVLGARRAWWRAVEPTIDFARAVPPLLVFPLLLLGLGYGEEARIGAVAFGTTGIIVLHAATAMGRVPRARTDVLRLAGVRGLTAFRLLHLPELLPSLLTAVRVALVQALIIATATEMILGAPAGLGVRAVQAQLTYRADRLWLVIGLAGAVGLILSGLVATIERSLDERWRGSDRGGSA